MNEQTYQWYMVNKDGMCTLCADQADAEKEAKDAQDVWPHMGPHRAVRLVEVGDAGFTAADMATAAAQGFRDGQAEELAAMRAGGEPVAAPMVGEMALIAKALQRVGITNVLNHGAASCVFSQGCAGVSQGHLLAYTREIALQCAAALYTHPQPAAQDAERWMELGQAIEQACMTLPEGVEVAMSFEQDAWKVKWFDENGNEHDTESHESGVASVMNDAIDTAIAAQGENKNMSERAFHTTGYITPAQPRTNDVARAIVEAADMNDRVLVAIDAEFAAPAQQPWKDTPPAQERIQALELEVRQLTEQIAELRHAPTTQADSQPAPANTRQIAECYGDCPEDPKTCANPCKFEGRAARAPADSVLEDAARDVLAERARQIGVEGWTPEHDDEHECGDMARAAACYLLVAAGYPSDDVAILRFWPWLDAWWKPTDQRRDLVKAGALILAEIERIDRAARKQGANHDL